MRSKSPGQLNTRMVRVTLAAHAKLKFRAERNGTSMTEELDSLLGVKGAEQPELSLRAIPAHLSTYPVGTAKASTPVGVVRARARKE